MPPALDILSLLLLGLIALIVLLFWWQWAHDDAPRRLSEDAIFYQQQRYDPTTMSLPMTGLNENGPTWQVDGYLPADLTRYLQSQQSDGGDDASGLAAALRPGPKTSADRTLLRLTWTISALVVLLGLLFLIIWLL